MAKTIHERKPRYEVWDWVEIEQEYGGKVKRFHRKVDSFSETSDAEARKTIVCGEFEFTLDGEPYDCPCDDQWHPAHRISRKLNPSEVVLDFGSGIIGTVEALPCECCRNRVFILRVSEECFIEIPIGILIEPMKGNVLSLLKAQEEG